MNRYTLIPLFIFCISSLMAQQWVDKQYPYDSLLNVPYGTAINFNGEVENLSMDIYLPVCADSNDVLRRPLLMWIHGGAFLAGSKEDGSIQDLCKQFAKRGYVTASINYRLGFVSDDNLWQCNYPEYNCVFATDSAEWTRAYYRAVQDAKGALRYLVNRNELYNIDTNNVFVAGESAGAFTALGVGLMDTITERPAETYAITDAPLTHPNNLSCSYNQGKVFSGTGIPRPDLGGIEGSIEPSTVEYTIRGIGNIYGAMYSDLLKEHPSNMLKPAIYSFHQPCDIIVPIDSNYVFWGLSWCFTNGYNCNGIVNNNTMVYGSRAFSNWNTSNNYGYTIQDEFTAVNFPYSFVFGQGSCLDQVNNPCHAYDNKALRENNLAQFFSNLVTTSAICDTSGPSNINEPTSDFGITIYPNPVNQRLVLEDMPVSIAQISIIDLYGRIVFTVNNPDPNRTRMELNLSEYEQGVYLLVFKTATGNRLTQKFIISR